MAVASDRPASDTPLVIVWDDDDARAERIRELLAGRGARCVRFGQRPADLRDAKALVVAVAEHWRMPAPASDALRHASSAGLRTLAYANGVSAWNTVAQCEVMLLGASRLLDSAAPDFDTALERELAALLRQSAGAAGEQAELQARMAEAGFVARSPQIFRVFRLVTRLSQLSDIPVLIEGESGTGKEIVARALHRSDPKRSHGPFIAVNCAAISPGLAESELFGHVRGAFTGAERQRKGLLRAAAGGVLFLDEVGEMTLDLQAKMLRVLQDGEVLSVGDESAVRADVRVIAATNRSLSGMVSEGRFRADLYHRLNVVPVRIPPLRERLQDVEPLLCHLVEKHRRLLAAPCTLGRDFADALQRLPLPGNARELENIVRQALVAKQDAAPLGLRDLPAEVWQEICLRALPDDDAAGAHASRGAAAASSLGEILRSHRWKLSDSLSHCEREMIDAALLQTKGNRTKAALLLGITPRSMYNKLRRPHP